MPTTKEQVDAANAALDRLSKTGDDWLIVTEVYYDLRLEAMASAGAAEAKGTGYNNALRRACEGAGFKLDRHVDEQTRRAMARIMENRADFDRWRARLSPKERRDWSHPVTMFRHFAKSPDAPEGLTVTSNSQKPKQASRAELLARIAQLEADNASLVSEVDGGRDANWKPNAVLVRLTEDTPQGMAKTVLEHPSARADLRAMAAFGQALKTLAMRLLREGANARLGDTQSDRSLINTREEI